MRDRNQRDTMHRQARQGRSISLSSGRAAQVEPGQTEPAAAAAVAALRAYDAPAGARAHSLPWTHVRIHRGGPVDPRGAAVHTGCLNVGFMF